MNAYSPDFDLSEIDTPDNLNPAVSIDAITGVPSTGTGLDGAAYAPGDKIWSISRLEEIIAENDPDATFVSTQLAYGANKSDTSIAEFLGDDAASIQGDGSLEMGPSGLTLTGYIYIPPGAHAISMITDDGFTLSIGGVPFSDFEHGRGADDTTRVANFEGGLYQIDIQYFDGGGGMALAMAIDGLIVDDSAFYRSVDDFTDPTADVPLVPVEDYHPSHFVGEAAIGPAEEIVGDDDRDVIEGNGGDDTILGNGGDDELYGGYGDDSIEGGDGDDVIDGGRGSDILFGGAGDDILISKSDAGEQRIGQLAIDAATRGDPDGEVDEDRQKLSAWLDQPLVSDDILIGGEGRDVVLVLPSLNAKLDIIQQHVKSDGSINWAGVAGENDELHDHWVDHFGIDIFADYVAGEDQIAVIGHTANVYVDYRDTDGDGDEESIITVISQQHGGGGAHTQDLLGHLIVHGDRVEVDDIITDAGVTYGVVENYADVAEAIYPLGELKQTVIDGEIVYGYDTRGPDGELGPITGSPEDFIDNPYLDSVEFGDPTPEGEEVELTRYPFDQLPVETAAGQTKSGGDGNDFIAPDAPAEPDGLPGALLYYSFADGVEGAFADGRGGPAAKAYTLYENQALLRTDGLVDGPNGEPNGALSFNGDEEFAYIPHTKATMITQGTIALWVQPQDLDDCEIILSKDQKNTGDGGHFRLGHSDDGGLFIRMAPGDGSSNRAWETHHQVLEEGEWAHIAVNFTATGVTVFVNGEAIPDGMWRPKEGDDPSPGSYLEAYILNNQEPWVLGADQARTEVNDTAQIFALDDEDLANAFEGAVAGFGVWGGMDADDALTQAEIQQLIADGPGAALTNPSGPQPIIASDDTFSGGAGDDTIKGDAGDDTLNGGDDDDLIYGGYGDDLIDGGDGNDTIDGGRGSDLVMGGAGDDVLISRSDVGEDRAGQLVLGEPSRAFPDPQIDPELLKLADWIDQPLVADDILVGGEGADHFQIETLINGTMESIMDNLFGGTRVVRWHGVAGENARIHDHWVDGIGIDIIADFEADKDHISIIGHTTEIDIHYQSVDTNGDDVVDSVVSVITVYSQQGNNGGAHDEDILGYVVVHGDVVTEDMVETDAGAHYGIVHTIDELQEALAPNGETKISTGPNGEELFGYDSRDVDGDPIGSDPEAYSSNPYKDLVSYDDQTVQVDPFAVLVEYESGSFDGETAVTIAHQDGHSPEEGTIALTFTAEEIGPTQALYSKDHNGYEDGGHLTIWLDHKGKVNVRIQDQNNSYYLRSDDHRVEAGEETNIAFSFDGESLLLFVNGELADAEDGFEGGMSGNAEDAVLGASTRHRRGDDDKLDWFFTGAIANLFFIDRPITTDEAMLLAAGGGELDVLALNVSDPADDPQPDDGDPPEDDPVGDDPADDDDGSDDGETGDDESDDDDNADGDGEDGDAEDGDDDGGDDGDDDEPEVADDPIITAGTGGADEIEGGSGADDLSGRGGADTVMGGEGADTIKGGAGADDLSGGEDGDIIRGQAGRDAISGDEGDDRLLGGGGADTLNGGADRDKLLGGGGRDQLFGGEGMDTLKGGGGADTLDGGEGRDIYVGGGGADVFVFGDDGAKNVVRDYRDGRDKIQIDSEVAASFGDLDIQTKGKHVVVSYGDTEVLVRKTDEADLDANDFIF